MKKYFLTPYTHQKLPAVLITLFLAITLPLIVLNALQTQKTSTEANEHRQSNPNEGGGPIHAVSEEVSPMVKIILPEPNASVTNPVTVSANVESGQSITQVEFWKDKDTTPFYTTASAPFETSVTFEPGRHRISIVAYDEAQNVKRSQEVVFTVQ